MRIIMMLVAVMLAAVHPQGKSNLLLAVNSPPPSFSQNICKPIHPLPPPQPRCYWNCPTFLHFLFNRFSRTVSTIGYSPSSCCSRYARTLWSTTTWNEPLWLWLLSSIFLSRPRGKSVFSRHPLLLHSVTNRTSL